MSRLELAIAWRYLRSRSASRLLSFISVIAIGGVVVGVSALIVIIAVMTGLQNDLREKILIGSPDIRILRFGDDLTMSDSEYNKAMAVVKRHPAVVEAGPFVLTEAGVTAGHAYGSGASVQGIPPAGSGAPEVTGIRRHAVAGGFRFQSADGGGKGVVVGKRLAERLNVYPGDKITLVSFAGASLNASVGTFIPRMDQFEVTGLLETGMFEYDNAYIYMALDAAREFAGLGNGVTGIEVKTRSRWEASEVAEELGVTLGFPYRALDWQEQNAQLFSALKLEKLAMGIILLLIVIVAAFNIVSTLSMVVKDKTREIGILRAMGMRARAIRGLFLVQGLVIGVVGTGLGLLIGLAAAFLLEEGKFIKLDPQVYFIDHLPVTVEALDVLWIVLASVAIAALATLYPAVQAARLYPVEAIRHE